MAYELPSTIAKRIVPADFWVNFIRAAIKESRAAYEACAEFEPSEMHDAFPHLRRAHIEQAFRDVARMHGADTAAPSNAHGGAYHSTARWPGITMTLARADSPSQLPREAVFRDTLAMSAQRDLFKNDDVPPTGDSVFAVLTYGNQPSTEWKCGFPAFVSVVFPDQANQAVIDFVDLTLELHKAITMVTAEDEAERRRIEETEKRDLGVKLKPARKTKSKENP